MHNTNRTCPKSFLKLRSYEASEKVDPIAWTAYPFGEKPLKQPRDVLNNIICFLEIFYLAERFTSVA